MKNKVISADSHVDLHFIPEDLFISNTTAEWRDRVPSVVETKKGRRWQADGIDRGPAGTWRGINPSLEQQRRLDMFEEIGLFDTSEGGYRPTTPRLRIQDQDRDGVDGEVIYGLLDLPKEGDDPGLKTEIFRIYNSWIADFCESNPERFAGLACLANHDPELSAAELHQAAGLGLKGAEINPGTMSKPLYHSEWDVLWFAAQDTSLPVSFHTIEWWPRRVGPAEADSYKSIYAGITSTMFQLTGVEYLSSIIVGGACERYPEFKFVLGECGISWIPYVLDRMDQENDGQPWLTLKPSDYFRRQGYSTFEKEGIAGDLIPLIGEENVMWGSDYPHVDGSWPNSQKEIERNFRNLKSTTARRKVTCDNAAQLYGFSRD